ncbi:hemagglutinin/amebocyte aggregation factor-like [Alosa sapidissima]|uniref:hemagglutinin/amebocyte aggregation factor-like n=1 Tax=Alosa sapidissima TaxID=34773 RepID=UPI001C0A4BDA|nr:hemagglutinin/amebocyte aggregation factor-like [Alosa sapidissima]
MTYKRPMKKLLIHYNNLGAAMKKVHLLFLLLASVLVKAKDLRWVNSYDERFHFACPTGQSIYHIISQHKNEHEDRLWNFSCKYTLTSVSGCLNYYDVNGFDDDLNFQCPYHKVITEIGSYHDNHHEDRRWSFTCCGGGGYCTGSCSWTSYQNNFDGPLDYIVPSGYYLVGASSYHENKHEDRRWQFLICSSGC